MQELRTRKNYLGNLGTGSLGTDERYTVLLCPRCAWGHPKAKKPISTTFRLTPYSLMIEVVAPAAGRRTVKRCVSLPRRDAPARDGPRGMPKGVINPLTGEASSQKLPLIVLARFQDRRGGESAGRRPGALTGFQKFDSRSIGTKRRAAPPHCRIPAVHSCENLPTIPPSPETIPYLKPGSPTN